MSPSGGRDWRLYVEDIMEACGKIRRFIAGREAAKNVPAEKTATAPQVPWRLVSGMRDVLAHGYFGVSTKVVWDTA